MIFALNKIKFNVGLLVKLGCMHLKSASLKRNSSPTHQHLSRIKISKALSFATFLNSHKINFKSGWLGKFPAQKFSKSCFVWKAPIQPILLWPKGIYVKYWQFWTLIAGKGEFTLCFIKRRYTILHCHVVNCSPGSLTFLKSDLVFTNFQNRWRLCRESYSYWYVMILVKDRIFWKTWTTIISGILYRCHNNS